MSEPAGDSSRVEIPLVDPVRRLFATLALALLAACGSGGRETVHVVAIGAPGDPFQSGIRLAPAGQLTRAATTEGLVAFDAQGRVVPALADRWIVTDDGKSYLFRLRDGTWGQGGDLTARSAVRSLNAAIRALRGTALGLDLDEIDEIREMAGRVMEIRLSRPMPHFLQLLAQPELGLFHEGAGAGPMILARQGGTAVLTPLPPEERGLPAERNWQKRVRTVDFRANGAEAAVEAFNHGEVDLVLGGRIQDFPRTSSVGILRGTIQLDPVTGLFGLAVIRAKGFLRDADNREAVAMAIQREDLIQPFGLDGWIATARIVPPGIEGVPGTASERWAGMTIDQRRQMAAARVLRWRDGEGGGGAVRVTVGLPEGPGADILFERLAGDLARIGVELVRAGKNQRPDLRLLDEVARYPRPMWFLNQLSCTARRGLCSSSADASVAQAGRTENAQERAALLGQAEEELTRANVFIPFGSPIRWSLVRGSMDEFVPNQWGWHPLMPLAVLPR